MTFTNRDRVRLLVGDTNTTDAQLSDAEIDIFIVDRTVLNDSGGTVSINLPAAAADAAGAIAAKFSRQFDFAEDAQSFSRSQRVAHFQELERELRNRSGGYAVAISGSVTP